MIIDRIILKEVIRKRKFRDPQQCELGGINPTLVATTVSTVSETRHPSRFLLHSNQAVEIIDGLQIR
jgi:hypothetical protein